MTPIPTEKGPIMGDDEKRTYPTGVPCWVQLDTPDTAGAAAFYAGLFGWTYANAIPTAPAAYLFARLDGADAPGPRADVAALALSARSEPGAEAPHGWVSFIATDDIEQTCADIEAAGGTLIELPDAGSPFGRGARCADPLGAVFGLWEARAHPGAQVVNAPGAWNFSDLVTPDIPASMGFYSTVWGWEYDPGLAAGRIRLPGYGAHLASTVDPGIHERQSFAPEGFADAVAEIFESTDDEPAPGWWVRFAVADRDESALVAERLGGEIVSRTDTEWTLEAVLRDPQGNAFIVSQLAPRS